MNERLNQHSQQPDLGAEVFLYQVDLSEQGGPVLYLAPDARGDIAPDHIISLTSSIPDNATFTRASEATYFDHNGVLQVAASGEPRFDWRAGEALGYLSEPAATNLLSRADPTKAQLTTSTADVVDRPFGRGFTNGVEVPLGGSTNWATTQIAVVDATDYVYSFFVMLDDGSEPVLGTDFSIIANNMNLDGVGGVIDHGDGLYRVYAPFTASGTSGVHGLFKYANDSSKTVYVTGFQLEQAGMLSSLMLSAGSPKARVQDQLTIPNPVTTAPVSVVLDFFILDATGLAVRFFELGTDTNNKVHLYYGTGGVLNTQVDVAGSSVASTGLPAQPFGRKTVAFAVDDDDLYTASSDGDTDADTGTFVTPPSMSTIYVGYASQTSAHWRPVHTRQIRLFESRLTDSVLKAFAAGTELPVISFGGQVYTPFPIVAEGFQWKAGQAPPRPRLAISNLNHAFTGYILQYRGMVGAKVTRLKTFEDFLDGGASPDGEAHYPPDIYRINRRLKHNSDVVEFELASRLEQRGKKLPGRLCLRDYCSLVYRDGSSGTFDYTNATCPFTGPAMFDRENNVVVNEEEDICSHTLKGCRLRFPDPEDVPFGGFPGMLKTRLLR